MLRPGLATSAWITVMGCAPPTLPTAGQEARLGWTPMEKQAERAPSPESRELFPSGHGSVSGELLRGSRAPGQGRELSLGHSQPFASPVLSFPTPRECQAEGLSPSQARRAREGMPRPCQAACARCGSAAVQGFSPGNGIPCGSGPIPQPNTDILWCRGRPRSSGGKGNSRRYPQEAGEAAEAAQGPWTCRDGSVFFPPVCGCDLAQSGFFFKNQEYICTHDYQQLYGTRCDSCGDFITGEVISALGRTYHPKCFVCSTCR